MKLMSKDEFKEALKNAGAVSDKLAADEIIEENPKRRPGRPKKIEIKDKAMSAQPKPIETKKGAKPESKRKPKKELKESAPVAAARFSIKEREALQCLAEIAENHTADVMDKASALMDQADKLTNISTLYREYIETVKEMIK